MQILHIIHKWYAHLIVVQSLQNAGKVGQIKDECFCCFFSCGPKADFKP